MRLQTLDARSVRCARIVLLAADGVGNPIMRLHGGLKSVGVRLSPGEIDLSKAASLRLSLTCRAAVANQRLMPHEIVRMTTQTTPEGATHWSTRKLAAHLSISDTTVLKVWRVNGLKPHLVETFKVSRDPNFVEKFEDIVGLYMSPSEHALILCCDEKSQVQALDRTQPGLPLKKGQTATMTHDYKRHGQDVAGEASALPCPFHPDLGFLAQHGRALLSQYFDGSTGARCLPQRARIDRRHRGVHRRA